MIVRSFEIVGRAMKRAKLTVAVDRTSLKIPLGTSPEERSRLTALAAIIQDAIIVNPQMREVSWRGYFHPVEESHENSISLSNSNRSRYATFDLKGKLVRLTEKEGASNE